MPGECWAFEGSVGDVVIQLVSPAVLTGFTMEHIPKLVSPYGNIDSAPYQFQVLVSYNTLMPKLYLVIKGLKWVC